MARYAGPDKLRAFHHAEQTMSQTLAFRLMIGLGFVLGCLGPGVDYLVPGLVPDAVRVAIRTSNASRDIAPLFAIAMVLVMVFIVVAGLASTIGLLLLKRWARGLALWVSIISLSTYPALGPLVFSGWSLLLIEVSMALWGAALGMAYFSELNRYFGKPQLSG